MRVCGCVGIFLYHGVLQDDKVLESKIEEKEVSVLSPSVLVEVACGLLQNPVLVMLG